MPQVTDLRTSSWERFPRAGCGSRPSLTERAARRTDAGHREQGRPPPEVKVDSRGPPNARSTLPATSIFRSSIRWRIVTPRPRRHHDPRGRPLSMAPRPATRVYATSTVIGRRFAPARNARYPVKQQRQARRRAVLAGICELFPPGRPARATCCRSTRCPIASTTMASPAVCASTTASSAIPRRLEELAISTPGNARLRP